MNAESDAAKRQEQFESLQAEYLHAPAASRPALRLRMVQEHPDLAGSLESFFDTDDRLRRLAAPVPEQGAGGDVSMQTDSSFASSPGIDADATSPDDGGPIAWPGGTRVRHFGDYELLGFLAQGGMGTVYRARQISLDRDVAIKMVRAGAFASQDDIRRFHTEAEAAAAIDHPNIVPIYEVGEHERQHYYSMKLFTAGSLRDRLTSFGEDLRTSAELVAKAARAVQHAHERGILHRDLKPANILLDERGEPHVADFGLAKRVEDEGELTDSGAIMGTPGYMAPEQTTGHRRAVTTATDVYGLGAILYALLSGRAPFTDSGSKPILDQVRNDPPDPPTRTNPRVPHDLEVICLKCLEKNPGHRYRSAQALADDLDNWLAGRPISARPIGRVMRTWMWCRRNPAVALLSTFVTAIVAAVTAAIFFGAHEAGIAEAKTRAQLVELRGRITSLTSQGRVIDAEAEAREAAGRLKNASPALRHEFGQDVADALMQASLLKVRHPLSAADWAIRNRRAVVPSLYEQAFQTYGIDPSNVAVASRIVRQSKIRFELLVALEDWSGATIDRDRRDRLREITDRADPSPDSPIGQVLRALRRPDRNVLATLSKAEQVRALPPQILISLAVALRRAHDDDSAIGLLRDAWQRHRGDYWIAVELGSELYRTARTQKQEAEADELLSIASAIGMGSPLIYMYAGIVTYNAGIESGDQHQFARSASAYRKAIEVSPRFAPAYCNLGNSLTAMGQREEAIKALQKAIELDPNYALPHFNLAVVLEREGKTGDAKTHYAAAISRDPTYREAFANLAGAQYRDGDFAGAVEGYRRWLELAPPDDPSRKIILASQQLASGLAAVEPKLKAVREGKAQPTTAAEALDLARLCSHPKHLDRSLAAELFHKAFEQDPSLADDSVFGDRYAAAETAAIAAGARTLGEDKRSAHRRWALEWLRQELAVREAEIREGLPAMKAESRDKLRRWLSDQSFAGLRGPNVLKGLPKAESEAWTELWNRVRGILESSGK